MDHVVGSMKVWLNTFAYGESTYQDEAAIECIKNAIKELEKYFADND